MAKLIVKKSGNFSLNEMTHMQLANAYSLVEAFNKSDIENKYKIRIEVYARIFCTPMDLQKIYITVNGIMNASVLEYSFYIDEFELYGIFVDRGSGNPDSFTREEFNTMSKMLDVYDHWVPRYIGIHEFRKAIKEGKEKNEN